MIALRVEDAHGVVELDQALREKARGIGLSDTAVSYEQHVGLGRRHPDSATIVRPPQRNLPATRRGQWRTGEDPIVKEIRDGFAGVGRENGIGFSLQGIDGIADCNGKLAVAKQSQVVLCIPDSDCAVIRNAKVFQCFEKTRAFGNLRGQDHQGPSVAYQLTVRFEAPHLL